MKKSILTVKLMALLSISCSVIGSDEQDLGDNYYYLPEYEAIDVGFTDGPIIYKSKEKYLFSDIKLRGNINKVEHDDSFILVSKISEDSLGQRRQLLYYIIIKATDSLSGPFDEEQYLERRNRFKIPKNLVLD